MLYGRYTFRCEFQTDALLPPYKGSTFRGVFGIALKNIVCALRRQECENCLLNTDCIYPLVFETHLTQKSSSGAKAVSPPHPFVIEPPESFQTDFKKGDYFSFSLLLFGQMNRNLPYFIYAFKKMGKIGVGKRINGKRGRFSLEKVKAGRRILYVPSEAKLRDIPHTRNLTLAGSSSAGTGNGWIRITLKTPLRIKYKSRLSSELPFHVLVRGMLRRMSSLLSCYGDGEPEIDYPGLVKRARLVEAEDNQLRWHDWDRYSSRQNQSMTFGGLVGSVTYKGELDEFMPLLDFCSRVHIGKQTAFGLGKFKVEPVE